MLLFIEFCRFVDLIFKYENSHYMIQFEFLAKFQFVDHFDTNATIKEMILDLLNDTTRQAIN